MKKIVKGLLCVLLGWMFAGCMVSAESFAAVLETYTDEEDISLYIKGAVSDVENVKVQIATMEAEQVRAQKISEQDVPMQTLVMIDNSLSIPMNDRDRIAEFLQNLISDRVNKEEISIAVFSEKINILSDYTSDYATLKNAADSIEYQDQETYLTDVLYDLLSVSGSGGQDVYHRIIVVSDGVDNKSLGYTKDELYALLEDVHIPIYTIGSVNGKNNDQLENMFALSRMTQADYCLLDEVENILDITNALNRDRDILQLSVIPPVEVMDGGRKTVKITFSNGLNLSTEVIMPQQVIQKEPEPAAKEELKLPVNEDAGIKNDVEDENSFSYVFIAAAAGFAAVVTGVFIIVLLQKKKNKKQNEFEPIDDNALMMSEQGTGASEEKTEMIFPFDIKNKDDSGTVSIWNQQSDYQIVLSDVNTPMRTFQVPLNKSVLIGRSRRDCDIVLDYEKSVSARHCEITMRNGKFYIKDLQSSNGTYLNESRVLNETEIISGNIIKLGRLEMRFDVK